MRVVLDTNVYVSALWTENGNAAKILTYWRAHEFEVVASTLVLAELRRVIEKPQFAWLREQRQDTVLRLMQLLWRQALLVDNAEDIAPLEIDPSDTKFLALAKAAGAHAIVTGDAHLLDLGAYEGIPVLTPAQFLDLLEQERG